MLLEIEKYIYALFSNIKGLQVYVPKSLKFGHLSTNAPFVVSRQTQKDISEIVNDITVQLMSKYKDYIDKIELAKNGFLNIYFNDKFFTQSLQLALQQKNKFGANTTNEKRKILVEYFSTNPTGPLHCGHARSVYGHALGKALALLGHEVQHEYYVNDAGNQIKILAKSVHWRYLELLNQAVSQPKEAYCGDYIIDIAQKIIDLHENKWIEYSKSTEKYFAEYAMKECLNQIKQDLELFNIKFDTYKYETTIYEEKYVEKAIQILKNNDLVYTGKLQKVKAKKGQGSNQNMLLFKTTQFEDDENRALTKGDGNYTYFAGDIGYHLNKIDREYCWLINVLGADHASYAKRIKAATQALSESLKKKVKIDITILQIVLFESKGESLRFSKRSGTIFTLRDMLKILGCDLLRFVLLQKKPNAHYSVNIDEIKQISLKNPFYYIQYAHARICSLFRQSNLTNESIQKHTFDINHLSDSMKSLLFILIQWPREIYNVQNTLEVHTIITYLYNIAETFHSIWNEGKENNQVRWIVSNENITLSRFQLLQLTKTTISIALSILEIEAYNELNENSKIH